MTILLVHNFYQQINGEDLHVLSLEKLLRKKGETLRVYAKHNSDIQDNFFSKLKIGLGLFWNRKVQNEFSNLLIKYKPDVVHVNNVNPLITPVVYKICKKLRIPVIQTVHNYRLICPGGFMVHDGKECIHSIKGITWRSLINNCYRDSYVESFVFSLGHLFHKLIESFAAVDLYLFPASFVLDTHKRLFNLPSNKIKVLPYFLESKNIPPNGNKKRGYFLFLGRLSEEKGIISLLKIFSTLPNIKLIVIGDGPLKEGVMKFRKFKNIQLKFVVSRKKIFRYISNALFTIIPSVGYETGPKVMIESFAAGTPVIVPKKGVFKNAIKDWETGIFFRYNDHQDLRKKILDAWRYKEKNKEMSKAAREFFNSSNYKEEDHYENLIQIYKELIDTVRLKNLSSL